MEALRDLKNLKIIHRVLPYGVVSQVGHQAGEHPAQQLWRCETIRLWNQQEGDWLGLCGWVTSRLLQHLRRHITVHESGAPHFELLFVFFMSFDLNKDIAATIGPWRW